MTLEVIKHRAGLKRLKAAIERTAVIGFEAAPSRRPAAAQLARTGLRLVVETAIRSRGSSSRMRPSARREAILAVLKAQWVI